MPGRAVATVKYTTRSGRRAGGDSMMLKHNCPECCEDSLPKTQYLCGILLARWSVSVILPGALIQARDSKFPL
jgi:hypothetical protein